jgi:hypothetical protein
MFTIPDTSPELKIALIQRLLNETPWHIQNLLGQWVSGTPKNLSKIQEIILTPTFTPVEKLSNIAQLTHEITTSDTTSIPLKGKRHFLSFLFYKLVSTTYQKAFLTPDIVDFFIHLTTTHQTVIKSNNLNNFLFLLADSPPFSRYSFFMRPSRRCPPLMLLSLKIVADYGYDINFIDNRYSKSLLTVFLMNYLSSGVTCWFDDAHFPADFTVKKGSSLIEALNQIIINYLKKYAPFALRNIHHEYALQRRLTTDYKEKEIKLHY